MSILYQDYEIISQIGNGSFSSVYKARRKVDDVEVAIKVVEVKCENDLFFIKNEEKILKTIMGGHPSIPILYDIFSEGPFYFIIMEYLEDYIALLDWTNSYVPLIFESDYESEKIQELIKIRESDITEIFANIISAIKYLHSKSVIHRDLKLENIMINPNTKSIKIIDYGFSIISDNMNWSTICGSFEYLSPEILQDIIKHNNRQDQDIVYSKYSIQSEVWSIGVILYGMIFCRLPFYHQSKIKLFNLILNADISLSPESVIIDENLKNLLLLMLDKNPQNRIEFDKISQHPFLEKFFISLNEPALQDSQTFEENLALVSCVDHCCHSESLLNKNIPIDEELHLKDNIPNQSFHLSPLALKKVDFMFSSNDSLPLSYRMSNRPKGRRLPQYKKRLPPGVTIKKPKM